MIKISAGLQELEIGDPTQKKIPLPEDLSRIPPSPLRQAIEILYPALAQANKVFAEAFDGLSKEEIEFSKRELQSFLLGNEDKRRLRHEDQEETEKALLIASRIDRGKMLQAAYIVASALDEALKLLSALDFSQIRDLAREERIVLHTPLGEILIGGVGDDTYTGKIPLLLIDLGGNEEYRFEEYSPLSVIIDLSGDDRYYSTENGWLGAGILGLGFLIDLRGNDIYRGKDFSFGAGFFGVGLLFDGEGNDRYISGIFSQGAGAMGVGILCDIEGDDRYQTDLCGQGFGFVGGGGFLLDHRGNDTLIAGGVIPDFREESNAFQTLSQGFGFGIRPFASGGLGILYDGEGDDIYEGSYFSQGSAYWLSIGLLIDRSGNDLYRARRYSQGAGTHWAVGALIDSEGNDRYISWGVSQGCGHDRSVGILWDGRGNDHYSAEWLSQGAGNDTGIGLLIDERGDDVYDGGKDRTTQGFGKFDTGRDEGSLGFLVDGGGEDIFSDKGKEGQRWKNGRWGGGIDYHGTFAPVWKEPFRGTSRSAATSFGFKEREGREWDRFILPELEGPLITGESQTRAADALSKRGPSIIPSLLKYLGINEVSLQGVLGEIFKRLGRENVEKLLLNTQREPVSKGEKRFLLYLLGEIGNPGSKKIFFKFLREDDPSAQAMALRGLSKLKETLSSEDARSLSKSKNRDVRRYLALSLQTTHRSPEFIPLLVELLNDEDFNVRFAAAEALRTFGTPLRN